MISAQREGTEKQLVWTEERAHWRHCCLPTVQTVKCTGLSLLMQLVLSWPWKLDRSWGFPLRVIDYSISKVPTSSSRSPELCKVSKRNRQVWTGFSKTKHWREMVTEKCPLLPMPTPEVLCTRAQSRDCSQVTGGPSEGNGRQALIHKAAKYTRS